MQSNLTFSRSIFPWGYSAKYSVASDINSDLLARVIETFLKDFLPNRVFFDETLEDMKGNGEFSGTFTSASPNAGSQESKDLIFIAGRLPAEEDEASKEHKKSEQIREQKFNPFQISLASSFDHFVGNHHIVYKLREFRKGDLPSNLRLKDITEVSNIEFTEFRIDFELFHSWSLYDLWDFAPAADQRLSLLADRSQFRLSFEADSLKRKTDFPLGKEGYFEKLISIFEELFRFDLEADYLRQIT